MGVIQWLVQCAAHETDDPDTAYRKRLVLTLSPPFTIGCLAVGISGWGRHVLCYTMGNLLLVLVGAFLSLYTVCRRAMPLPVLEVALISCVCGVILVDWAVASDVGGARPWTTVVLVMDVFLAVGGARWAQAVCLHGIAVWLCVSAAEDGFRLGLYDIDGWTETFDSPEAFDEVNCANPPCARGPTSALAMIFVFLLCLYLDFVATRGFAEGQRRERERVTLMVRVAEQVAARLVRFDLTAAGQALKDAGEDGLSPELAVSFHSLLANLTGYRPYLPQSCFEDQDEEPEAGSDGDEQGPGRPPAAASAPATETAVRPLEDPFAAEHPPLPSPTSMAGRRRQTLLRRESQRRSLSADLTAQSAEGNSSFASAGTDDAGDAGRPVKATPRVAHAMQNKRVTLLATNRTGFLGAVRQGASEGAALSAWLAAEVASFCSAVVAQKGVVDLLSGDHLHANFGALRLLGAHRVGAVRCAAALRPTLQQPTPSTESAGRATSSTTFGTGGDVFAALPQTAAVSTGAAICGDFGSDAARRFMVVGSVAAFLPVLERVAAGWACGILTDDIVHNDAETFWDCRLRCAVRWQLADRPVGLWEVCALRAASRRTSQTEWMYEMAGSDPNPWSAYNKAVALWCKGELEGARSAVAVALDRPQQPLRDGAEPHPPQAVGVALAALGLALDSASAPLLSPVPSAAGVGPAAPVLQSLVVTDAASPPVHCG